MIIWAYVGLGRTYCEWTRTWDGYVTMQIVWTT